MGCSWELSTLVDVDVDVVKVGTLYSEVGAVGGKAEPPSTAATAWDAGSVADV